MTDDRTTVEQRFMEEATAEAVVVCGGQLAAMVAGGAVAPCVMVEARVKQGGLAGRIVRLTLAVIPEPANNEAA